MRNSRKFIKFAVASCIGLLAFAFSSCKGRTAENMEPKGETIEVVIMQDTIVANNTTNN